MSRESVRFHNSAPLELGKIPIVESEDWRRSIIEGCTTAKGRVISLFSRKIDKQIQLTAVLGFDSRGELQAVATVLKQSHLKYPALTPELPETHQFERELFEQNQILPEGHPWLKPVRKIDPYPFYQIEGDQVHEGAVGPVHAGIIEPGHFRFQCHGEKVLHLEIQLGYQHRGVEQMMLKAKPSLRPVLAESIAGDTVIGHASAYAQTLEGLSECVSPERASAVRAIALELERLSNHAGDLGALANDIGFLSASAWFGRLRGEFLNLLMEFSGNRYGRSLVRPGGVLFDIDNETGRSFQKKLARTDQELREISDLFFDTASVRSRFEHTGILRPETASSLGLVGPVARASDLIRDVRHDYPTGAYCSAFLLPVRFASGDIYARARVREMEILRSLGLISELVNGLSGDSLQKPCESLKPSSLVLSLVEGWRGEIVHLATTNEKGEIDFYKIIDPSFRNWMGLALAMREGQISDFPLVNKSFNLSYAGHDL